jgi:hypothetical protein
MQCLAKDELEQDLSDIRRFAARLDVTCEERGAAVRAKRFAIRASERTQYVGTQREEMPTRRTNLRPNLTSVACAESPEPPTTVVAVVRFPCRQHPSIVQDAWDQTAWPLKYLFRCWFPFFHSKSRSGTLEIQTASRPRQSVSRLEIRRLVCSFCTAGTGPRETLG